MCVFILQLSTDYHLLSQTSQTWEMLRQSVKTECKLIDNTVTFWDTLASEYSDKIVSSLYLVHRLFSVNSH